MIWANILNMMYPEDKSQAKAFLSMAKDLQKDVIKKNTDKIIHELRKNIDHAIHAGRTHIHYFEEDYNEYEDLFDKQAIADWLNKWSRFDDFELTHNTVEGMNHYKLTWKLR